MGTATARAIKRFLTRRRSRGSSGIDHSGAPRLADASHGGVSSVSLPSIPRVESYAHI